MYYDKATIPELLMFIMYSRFIVMPIFRLVGFAEQYQQGVAAFERFCEIMNEKPDIEDKKDALDIDNVDGNIEFQNVYFKYDDKGQPRWVNSYHYATLEEEFEAFMTT